MSWGARVLIVGVLSVVLVVGMAVTVTAASLYNSGTIAVRVEEDHGSNVSVHVPAGLANLAISLAPDELIEEIMREARVELDPWWPAVQAAWVQFERAPDFVLVEVQSRDESVRVEKKRKNLLIQVGSGVAEAIEISVPLKTIRKLARKLDSE